MADEPTTSESLDRLGDLAEGFTSQLEGRLGRLARATGKFDASQVVTRGIQRLRLDVLNGAVLNPEGEEWLAGAAAYLGFLAVNAWHRRGYQIEAVVRWRPGDPENLMALGVFREREGTLENYSHDVLGDVRRVVLTPPQMMPTMRGRMYVVSNLALPPPEYLYLYGAYLTCSELGAGNWPEGESVGGLDEDFAAARGLMVDDLHDDVGLPKDDADLRKLTWWVVFPPYGWDMNDGQEYNMMTLVDQILFKAVVPRARASEYLRALLRSQTFHIRNLAARTLLVLGERPLDAEETLIFFQAINAGDHQMAEGPMLGFAWRAEGRAADTSPTPEWSERRRATWRRVVDNGPTEAWRKSPILADAEYQAAGRLENAPRAEQRAGIDALQARFPNNWFLETALGTHLIHSDDPAEVAEGERVLRACVESTPDCPTAHLTLGTALKYQGRRDEAMALFEDAVMRWPWNNQAVDSCMWLLTDGMTAPAG
jgi:hypothetical protein